MVLSIFLGSCQMSEEKQTTDPEKVDIEKLPNVKAFEDEFTKGFIQSINETEEGFYPFLSETDAYSMNFPQEGVIDERGYYVQDGTEKYSIGLKDNNVSTRINIKYYQFMKAEFMESSLQTLEENFDLPLQFQEKKLDGRTKQRAFYEDEDGYFGVVAIVQNTENNGAIEVTTLSECSKGNADSDCNQVKKDYKTTIYHWLESIKFITESE